MSTTSAVRLGHARGDRADATSATSFTLMRARGLDVLQIVDELRQVLDRVDVVVRRRADEAHAGRGVPRSWRSRVDLVARKLAAFAGLGALRHLDLQLVRVDEILARHAEAAGGDLLDRGCGGGRRSASGMNRSGSSPPSPVLTLPPMRFIAMASVSCASVEIEPSDIAPVQNRLTISSAGSTSSIGIGGRPPVLKSHQAAQRAEALALVVDELACIP